MKIHHLNCGMMHAMGGVLPSQRPAEYTGIRLVCHCLLVECADRLVLIDSGIGLLDIQQPERYLGAQFLKYSCPALDPQETAHQQIVALGFAPTDLRDIVLTHLHHDHVGGVTDFPWATVHVGADEFSAATEPPTATEARTYQPLHWANIANMEQYPTTGEAWHGFPAARPLNGLPPDFALIALPGHSRGHCGVAVQTGAGWLLHAGDAYFHHATIDPDNPHTPPTHANIERSVQILGPERLANQQRLLALSRTHPNDIQMFCAHDPVELEKFQKS